MLIKKFLDCQEIIAGDNCILRELLSSLNDKVESRYSIAHAKVPVGVKTFKHALKTTEVYFIIKGKGKMHINDEIEGVEMYDTIYIPPNAVQFIENTGKEELEFICIVDPAWKKENEIILISEKELLTDVKQSERDYKNGKCIKANSIAEALKVYDNQ